MCQQLAKGPWVAAAKTLRLWVATMVADVRGTSAIEFSFFAGLLSLALLNVTDVSIYIYKRMELENATQMGAQAAFKTCDPSNGYLPATTNCPGLNTAVSNAIQSTSLGALVQLQSGSPSEAYYCLNRSGALQYVSSVSQKLSDCSSVGMATLQPGDYIKISTSYAYTPMFSDISIASAFATPITNTAMIRLD
jgi:Flp pilus assembly protein TadG